MANKSQSTRPPAKSKPADNRATTKRSPEMVDRLLVLGIPKAHLATWPLTPHVATNRWCKKLPTPAGPKIFYFGPLADWQAALDRFNAEKDDLMAGRTPEARKDGLRVLDLSNRFLHFKRDLLQTGELTLRTWNDYRQTCARLHRVFGQNRLVEDLGPGDFEKLRRDLAETCGAVRISNEVTRTRMLFAYAFEQLLIEKPVRFGNFKKPARAVMTKMKAKARAENGPRIFEAAELRKILDAAKMPIRAMVMLAANTGFGNHDIATLPIKAVDLAAGIVDHARPKTGIERKIPLWPETVAAVKEWLAVRPAALNPEDASLLFLTVQGRPWHRTGRLEGEKVAGLASPLAEKFRTVLDRLGINGNRNFYCIRHGFETVAGDTGDQVAVNAIMGHADQSMAAVYRERINPERLRRVVDHVRDWLFNGKEAAVE